MSADIKGACPECGFVQQFDGELEGPIVRCRYLPCGAYLSLKKDGRLLLCARPIRKFAAHKANARTIVAHTETTFANYDIGASPDGEQLEIRPSTKLIRKEFAETLGGAGCAFIIAFLCLVYPFQENKDFTGHRLSFIVAITVGLLSLAGAVTVVRNGVQCNRRRGLALVIDRSGRIEYEGEELCSAGTNWHVSVSHENIESTEDDPPEEYFLVQIKDVILPRPYFNDIRFPTEVDAYEFARILQYGSRIYGL